MAKKFVPRQRKHKVLARQAREEAAAKLEQANDREQASQQQDSNTLEILPAEVRERNEKKARLREELRAAGAKKISGKKAKRLEKYIETKLKKDENRELQDKLAAQRVDTSLFESSRTLGQGRKRKRAALQRGDAEGGDEDEGDEEDASSVDGGAPNGVQAQDKETAEDGQRPEERASGAEEESRQESQISSLGTTAPVSEQMSSVVPPVVTGSGLKRPAVFDDEGRPIIQKRQKRGGVISKKIHLGSAQQQYEESEEEEWNGFSDEEASVADTGSEEGESEEMVESASESGDGDDDEDNEEQGDDEDEEDDEDDDGEEEDEGEDEGAEQQRPSGFKAWAQAKRNEALGFRPASETPLVYDIPRPENFKPRPLEEDPLPIELQPTANDSRKAFAVAVNRSAEIESARLALPIIAEEQKIMEAIHNNDVVVISGATGSGKTTQVPQFLYEAGYGSPDSPTPGMIGVTQPRRVAAVSMSRRVAEELGDHGHVVAYQIRFEGTAGQKTAIKFMTDGVLLREVAQDIVLRKYSAIIVDEAHERSINTDVLIGILSRVNKMREELAKDDPSLKPLKLIIMSATLKIEDLSQNPRLFPTPPRVIEVEGRQFPVTVHFSRRTRHDYVEEAFQKICRGHRKLPPGGILVFLTGEDEIHRLVKQLKMTFNGVHAANGPKVRIPTSEAPFEPEDIDFGGGAEDWGEDDDESSSSGEEGGNDKEEGDDDDGFIIEDEEPGTGPLRMNILPLYSKLPTKDQQRVFLPPPDGTRQVIVATNVAETSLTIPGIRYVFDCGRSKERKYNRANGVQSFEIGWISKASANQRSGRAGRTGPGHCYRLYSSAVFERDFAEFAEPEVLRMPIEGVVLQLKSMNVPNISMFPFPTPPDRHSLVKSERLLKYLSALSPGGQITELGSLMSVFPLSPRFAKILLVGHKLDCLHYTVALVAGLSADEIFVRPSAAIPAVEEAEGGREGFRTNEVVRAETERARIAEAFKTAHRNFCSLDDRSDAIKVLQVVGEFAHEPTAEWCRSHFVHFKALQEAQKYRRQIVDLLRTNVPAFANISFQDKLGRPSAEQITLLKQMVAAGFLDHVAIRADKAPNPPELYQAPRRAIDVPYLPLLPLEELGAHGDDEKMVYIHPSSPLAHLTAAECPEYLVYSHLQRAGPPSAGEEGRKKPKTRMRTLTDVTGAQLAALARGTPLLSYGKPVKETAVSADGRTRECWVVPYLRAEGGAGGLGWPLPLRKVKQRRVPGKGWVVE